MIVSSRFGDPIMISNEVIEQVKARVDILEVISDYVNLKKAGSSYRGLSPFNEERTPSFYVVPHKGFFKDFSSGKGGDAIAFLMELEGVSYMEAIKQLAKKYGIEIKEEEAQTPEDIQQQSERDSLYIIMNFATEYFKDKLWEDEEGQAIGLTYLKERKFSEETIRSFDLGYSLNLWDGLYKEAIAKGYQQELLEKAGLLIRKEKEENEDRLYDRFRGRVMFPIHNVSGRVIAFGARILHASRRGTARRGTADAGKSQPKYINSPETPIYHKSDVLYGIFQAKNAIRQQDNCYLVEGYTDVISMHQAGVKNVVASSGTSLTSEQIKLIKRYTENVTVLFDGDAAGIKASIRGIDMLLEGGLNVQAVAFPDGEDPDSYARSLGGGAFRAFLQENQRDFITFKTELYAAEAKQDPIKRAETIREIVISIAKIPDPIKRSVFTKECSVLLGIEESTLITEQNRIHLKEQRNIQRNQWMEEQRGEAVAEDHPNLDQETEPLLEEKQPDVQDKIALQERESIRLLISYGFNEIEESYRLQDYLLKELEDTEFETPIYRKILQIFKDKLAEGKVIDSEYLLMHGDSEVQQEVIHLESMAERYQISENWEARYQIYVPHETDLLHHVVFTNILRLKFRLIEKLIKSNQQDLLEAQNSGDEEDQITHLKIDMALKKSKSEIAGQLGIVVS